MHMNKHNRTQTTTMEAPICKLDKDEKKSIKIYHLIKNSRDAFLVKLMIKFAVVNATSPGHVTAQHNKNITGLPLSQPTFPSLLSNSPDRNWFLTGSWRHGAPLYTATTNGGDKAGGQSFPSGLAKFLDASVVLADTFNLPSSPSRPPSHTNKPPSCSPPFTPNLPPFNLLTP
jgi:hypothetical protein